MDMSIRVKLLSAIGACLVGFLVFGALARNTLEQTKINGDHYKEIVLGKDLVADILPPPEYIVEPYLLTYQLLDATEASRSRELLQTFEEGRKQFEDRHKYWQEALPAGRMKDLLMQDVYEPGAAFLKVYDNRFLPALTKGDRAAAREVATTQLEPLYQRHRAAVLEVVKLADEALKAEEQSAAAIVSQRSLWMTVFAGLLILGMVFAGYVVSDVTSHIVARAVKATEFATAMAQGDMTRTLEAGHQDEIGRLITALNHMRTNIRDTIAEIDGGVRTLLTSSSELSSISAQTSSSVKQMYDRASTVAAAAEESSANSKSVATSVEEASRNLESVASATEEMSSTVGDIASNSERARVISEQATAQAHTVHAMVQNLGQAARDIGNVTDTIKNIATQTSLLGVERDDRGRTGRLVRQGLRRRRQRGQGAVAAGGQGLGGHQGSDLGRADVRR